MKLPLRFHSSPPGRAPSARAAFLAAPAPARSRLSPGREQGAEQPGSQAPSTAARLDGAPPGSAAPPGRAGEESSLLEPEGLRLRKPPGPGNFHWGILGSSMQNVVPASGSSPAAGHGCASPGAGAGTGTGTGAGMGAALSGSSRNRSYLGSGSIPCPAPLLSLIHI